MLDNNEENMFEPKDSVSLEKNLDIDQTSAEDQVETESGNQQSNRDLDDQMADIISTNEDENPKVKDRKKAIIKEFWSWVRLIITVFLLTFLLNKFVVFSFSVPTESMVNTINVGDRIISFRCAYWFTEPKRGDIVVFPFPDDTSDTYIKRIIGLPGETIEGKDGVVYINGKELDESAYVMSDLDEDFGPYEIPADSYFMMGDNRDVSVDARYWKEKFVKKDDIISKAVLRFYPSIGVLK